jgi:ubiquinone/menaquinone biosynthesis C-methylase UbiE
MADYDPHAEDYDLWAADMVEDVQWYVSLGREATEPIVELGVGSGRVAIPIAEETGKRVIGIDRSPAMLAVGRERAGSLGPSRKGSSTSAASRWKRCTAASTASRTTRRRTRWCG